MRCSVQYNGAERLQNINRTMKRRSSAGELEGVVINAHRSQLYYIRVLQKSDNVVHYNDYTRKGARKRNSPTCTLQQLQNKRRITAGNIANRTHRVVSIGSLVFKQIHIPPSRVSSRSNCSTILPTLCSQDLIMSLSSTDFQTTSQNKRSETKWTQQWTQQWTQSGEQSCILQDIY